ncbi:MAG: hypothetical protein Q8N95_14035 [Desulfobacterales bacterium]|nr:hypothetical protein [Desulfobacterales bacterium]
MEREDLTNKVIGCAYRVYNKLGFGFESVYRLTLREADMYFGPLFWSGLTNHPVNPVR